MADAADMSPYWNGERLYGDDLGPQEREAWYADEAEGYAGLVAGATSGYRYAYHALNARHGFRHIRERTFRHALGFGSAYGHEFFPIADRIRQITILDASDSFAGTNEIAGVPCTYQKPISSGDLRFADDRFDLITCLGVLHHIPNVGHVVRECFRCLAPSGVMLLREPICSMGDWRYPRRGLTKRERGIPIGILDRMIVKAGFAIVHRNLCVFPLLPKCTSKLGLAVYNNRMLTAVDAWLSRRFARNIRYHRTGILQKLAPASVYYVLTKPGAGVVPSAAEEQGDCACAS